MANLDITNIDLGELVLGDDFYRDEVFTAGGANTYPQGTILARDSSTGNLVPFDPDDAGGVDHEIAKAVLPYELVTEGAGDVQIRALIAGRVKKERLSVQDGATITNAHLDQLRNYGIVPLDVSQHSVLDNQ